MVTVVSYGGGTNSTAMLVQMARLGEQIDAVVFADTGGERPETYAHIQAVDQWLCDHGYQPITMVRQTTYVGDKLVTTLEDECLQGKRLPGIAYGFGSCSDKWKQRPFKAWLRDSGITDATVCFGFDADEPHRANRGDRHDSGYVKRYPLIEWKWGRDECVAAIADAGLPQPGKSACFFCPSSKPREILDLRNKHQDLFARALTMEANADLHTIKGLGRNFSWRALVQFREAQIDLFTVEQPCGCYDGE